MIRLYWQAVLLSCTMLSCTWLGGPSEADLKGPAPATLMNLEIPRSSMALMRNAPRRKRTHTESPLGTNLAGINYTSRDWAFIDSMTNAMPFISYGTEWDDKRPIPKDARGFPKSLLSDQAAVSIAPTLSGGAMVLTYEGQGEIGVEAADGSTKVVKKEPGRIEFTVNRDTEVNVWIPKTKVGDPVRNVRMVPKAFEKSEAIFHPTFLDRLAPFKVLRFMDWGVTNNQNLEKWSDRTDPHGFAQGISSGVAYEYIVRLGNILQADIWICIPHKADDVLVANIAQLIAAGLDKHLKVYVEYSNEVWNGIFEQAEYAIERGRALGLDRDPFKAGARFQSLRTVQVMKIFEHAFADRPGTLVRVVGSQVGNKWHHADLLEYRDAKDHIDAIAVAPYFGHNLGNADNAELVKASDPGELLVKVGASEMNDTKEAIAMSTAYAKKMGKQLIAYEGGQHLIASAEIHNDPAIDAKFDALQRHPKMADLYADLLATWKDAGGGLFVHYTFVEPHSKWSKFGALEYQDQPRKKAPKLDALLTFAEKNPRWW